MVGTLVRGCRCAISWCDLDLTFGLAVTNKYPLPLKSCQGYVSETLRYMVSALDDLDVQTGGVTLVWPLTLALPEYFVLAYLTHIFPIAELYRLLQLIIILVLLNCAISIVSYLFQILNRLINKFYSFIT